MTVEGNIPSTTAQFKIGLQSAKGTPSTTSARNASGFSTMICELSTPSAGMMPSRTRRAPPSLSSASTAIADDV